MLEVILGESIIQSYEITASELSEYKYKNAYKQGRANPFDTVKEEEVGNTTGGASGGNTTTPGQGGSGSSSSGGSTGYFNTTGRTK